MKNQWSLTPLILTIDFTLILLIYAASPPFLVALGLNRVPRESDPIDIMLEAPWLPHNRHVRLDTACDPGWSGAACHFNSSLYPLLPAGILKPSAHSNTVISELQPSRSALSVTIAPRLLSCLRIKLSITG